MPTGRADRHRRGWSTERTHGQSAWRRVDPIVPEPSLEAEAAHPKCGRALPRGSGDGRIDGIRKELSEAIGAIR